MTIIILDIISAITYTVNYLALLKNLHAISWFGLLIGIEIEFSAV
jgi:hypothetical protein